MSIGPIKTEEEFKVKKSDQLKHATTRAFKDPLRLIFYPALAGLLGGLMFGAKFSWQVYAIIGALWIGVIFQSFNKDETILPKNI